MVGSTSRCDAAAMYAGKPALVKSKPALGLSLASVNRVQFRRVFSTMVGENV